MDMGLVVFAAGAAVMMVGGVFGSYQLYRLVQADAVCRGLKHPKFWGLFSVSGSNQSGLLLYLIGRRKYPVLAVSEEQSALMSSCKKKIGAGLIFSAAGAIACVASLTLWR